MKYLMTKKVDKPGFELMYCDSGKYIFCFSRCSLSRLPRKSQYQNKFLFPKPRKKNKPLSCFKIKNNLDVMCIYLVFIKE